MNKSSESGSGGIRVIVSGGGTGGHIFPAIAIAKAIQRKDPSAEILFVGALGKMEMEKVPQAGYKIIGLPIVGIQRRLTWKNVLVPFKIFASLRKARAVIQEFKPHVAIGVGGYASGPLLRVASGMGIKTLIQEQNSYPGITNKILATRVNKICVAYQGLEKYFPSDKIVHTGNPVRTEVVQIDGKRERAAVHFELDLQKKTVLVVGGSLGARTINHSVKACIQKLTQSGVQVIWQTGKNYFQTAHEFVQAEGINGARVRDFIREMDMAYAMADIIVSRAGAMSISELCLIGKPVILIPSPNVSEDHQTKNAMALVKNHAALLIPDAEAESRLLSTLEGLLKSEDEMQKLGSNIRFLGKSDAGEKIAEEVFRLVNPNNV